jgi:RNA polymerase sigma-70 factor (ECF subfamily)
LGDEELVRLVIQGDRQAFAQLVERYQGPIYNLAGQMVGFGEDARDLTQEIFLQVYRNLSSFRGEARFATWIYRVASNKVVDWLRKHRHQSLSIKDKLTRGFGLMSRQEQLLNLTPEEIYLKKEEAERVRFLLDSLPEKYRLVLVLHYYHGFSYERIAETLTIPARTVETRLYRARVMLKERIKKENNPEKGGVGIEMPTSAKTTAQLPRRGSRWLFQTRN